MILTSKHNIHSTSQYRLAGSHTDYSDADVERFFAKVGEPTETGCWLWLASNMDACGHGQFTLRRDGKQFHLYAHRVSWELNRGPIPAGLSVLHDCPGGDNAGCVNPAHLFLGTQADNLADARRKGRLQDGRSARVLTDAAYREILAFPRPQGSGVALAQKFGVTKTTISRIRNGHQGSLYRRDQTVTLERVPVVRLVVRGDVF